MVKSKTITCFRHAMNCFKPGTFLKRMMYSRQPRIKSITNPKMPALDLYHNAVKNALIKDGWIITADPYVIKYEDAQLYADLAAEKPIAAERAGQKIVVEIKSFVGKSLMYDFHSALGQYIVYRNLIQLTEPEYMLYLAIDDVVYNEFFQRKSIQIIVAHSSTAVNGCRCRKGGSLAMDKLEQYRSALKKILTQYYEMTVSASIAPDGSEVTERECF